MRPLVLLLALVAVPAQAVELTGRMEQGGLVIGQTRPGTEVRLDGRDVPLDDQGHFVLGFSRDAAATAHLQVGGQSQTLAVTKRDWQIQRIDGLPPAKVTPDPAQLARITEENRQVAEARKKVTTPATFLDGLVTPAEGVISGVFGSQRVLNGEARAPHSGTDVAAPVGAPVHAVAAGTVTLAHPDMYFTGQTVMIDHGLGVQSVYAHLSRTDVKLGQTVGQGQVIGAVGASGRATGPHLHWGLSWQDVRLDPQTVSAALPKPTQ
ncbi:MAG: M23 family metallopeptidase [Magnetospirillum sp.]